MNWVVGFINKINEECDEVRGGVKIENRENLGQCPNRGGGVSFFKNVPISIL